MKRLYLVEPVVALYAFSSFLIYPLVQQYIYRRLWQQLTNTTYPISSNSSRCVPSNSSSNHTDFHKEVQKQASLFSTYSELLSTIPSLIVTLLLVAYSDRGGRKITIVMPLIGSLIYGSTFLMVSFFELNIYLLIGSSFLSSLFGGLGTFLGGCFAYIADLCKNERQRTLRMAGVDMMIGLLSGVAAISTGYFLRAAGFNWPFLTSVLCQSLTLLYAIFILEETVKAPDDGVILDESRRRSALKYMVCAVYQTFSGLSSKCKVLLALMMFIFTSFSFAYVGGISLVTLYELNEPLCWNEVLIGYGSALSTTVFLTSFAGVSVLTYCRVPQLLIVLLGIMSVALGMILLSFAKTTVLMFIVRIPMLLSIMPFPVLRSMMSKNISKSEQGALFACLSFLESLTNNVSSGVFNSVYAATVSWYPGFVFVLAAGLCLIPLSALGVVALIGTDVSTEIRRAETFSSGEAITAEDDQENQPLLS
ncbi:Solute carrier family 46 member 3 [Oryzias melastigma]|nr:solute carrier family 46 member 3 [Oryzias melastigma]XP_024118363.1 solute carrier family 46 member 3 [Oryzias melastigma]KAF6716272.1 Solute carrier family 46 member 3 [Oryzias melastigma]